MVVDLVSLWSGPVRVRELEIANARLLLEADRDGNGNWVFAPGPESRRPSEPAQRSPVAFEHVAIRGLELVLRGRPQAEPVTLGVRELEAQLDPATRMIDVRGGGQFNEAPWEISGRLGTLEKLHEGHDVEQALTARIGEARLELRGRVRDPLVLGAPELDVGVDGPDIVAALKKISAGNAAFISRGDKSGTHSAEIRYWTTAGLASQRGSGYKECGCGMGPALNMAAATGAYVLADRGTWLAFKNRGDLTVLVEGDKRLFNQYGVIVVNPARHPQLKTAQAQKFADWIISPAGQAAIASYKIGGEQLFFPNADK